MIGHVLCILERILLGKPVRLHDGLLVGLIGACVYGAAMGTFSGRILQVAYSALKVPLLIGSTTLLALPSFFVLNTLLGLRNDLARSMRAIVASQAVVGLILAALAPYTLLWYATTMVYSEATLMNGLIFLVASLSAQWVLRRRYRVLVVQNRRHLFLLYFWILLDSFVGIQMGWLLRPFIGDPEQPTTFVRQDLWGNAYLILLELLRQKFGSR
jgi:hypothetical protein